MGRPKLYVREEVLDKALDVFRVKGFTGTSLQDLQLATGVNKSGLYSEFTDKEHLFTATLERYLQTHAGTAGLEATPQGWAAIEQFLLGGAGNRRKARGCLGVSSLRETELLPEESRKLLDGWLARVRRLLTRQVKAAAPTAQAAHLAELALTFYCGLRLAESGMSTRVDTPKQAQSFMQALRTLARSRG